MGACRRNSVSSMRFRPYPECMWPLAVGIRRRTVAGNAPCFPWYRHIRLDPCNSETAYSLSFTSPTGYGGKRGKCLILDERWIIYLANQNRKTAMRFLGRECERAVHTCSHHCEFMGYI